MDNYTEGKIKPVEIADEMKKCYIDYAMSVIIGRALPDVRDGLKPVHRRILYSMYDQGVMPDKPYKKSARTVGDVMGKYHPHGDSAIYDSMVRMAQDFSMRYPLVDGHGNFGSVDGDSAAAQRYTEARLQKITLEMMADINKDTVDFIPNYDGEEMEPAVLPSRLPNLLLNGSSGIAVGMATNIPPHNLGEIIDGIDMLIDNPDVEISQLMQVIKGPDFPTHGIILGTEGIRSAYNTGRGSIRVRARAMIEEGARGKRRIVVTELPYQVNKARLIEKIADLVRDKRIEGITELRDESDRDGMRIVMELRNEANAQVILNQLYKHTQMQDTFGVIMIALVNGEPKTLNLKEVLEHYIKHQEDVITRRCRFDLAKAQERAHILEGLRIALDFIDEVVATIRSSKSTEEARERLMTRFGLSIRQANAILEMRLRALTGLEREKVEEEYRGLIKTIAYLEQVLQSERMVLSIIKTELGQIKEKYNDERRTLIVPDEGEIDIEDLIAQEDMVITISHNGYIKRLNVNTYRQQRRGGRGITGMTTRQEDFVEMLFITTTHHYLLAFTTRGRCFRMKVHEIPEVGRTAKGTSLVNLLALDGNEKVKTVIPVKNFDEGGYLFMATKNGIVKKTSLKEFDSRTNGIIAIGLTEDDDLISVTLTSGEEEIMLSTAKGMAIRFHEQDVRPMGRTAQGVRGIRLEEEDHVVSMDKVDPSAHLLVVSERGYGKRTPLTPENYRTILRGGKGVYTLRCNEKTGHLVAINMVRDSEELMLITKAGVIIRINANDISEQSRLTQGVMLIRLGEDDEVMDVARVIAHEDVDESDVELN